MIHTPGPNWGRALAFEEYAGRFVVFRKIWIFQWNIKSTAF